MDVLTEKSTSTTVITECPQEKWGFLIEIKLEFCFTINILIIIIDVG